MAENIKYELIIGPDWIENKCELTVFGRYGVTIQVDKLISFSNSLYLVTHPRRI